MKPRKNPFFRSAALAASIVLTLGHALAADYYWDANGTATNLGGAGNWTTANSGIPWRSGSTTGTLVAWADGNTAILGGTAGAVTISAGTTITLPKITVTTSNYSLSGGTVAFGGTASNPGIVDVNGTTGFNFSSGATGSLKVMATGSTVGLGSSSQMFITGSTSLTSFELAMNQDQNAIILGNAAALGSASATVKLTRGVLNLGYTAGANIDYNTWATDLAGGTIRGRFALQTWRGATSLSANSMLMTRNASDAKLIFSSTGTIDLGNNTLTLMAGSASQGIELNGVISGAGNLVTGSNALGGSDNGNGTTTLNAANLFNGTATTTQNIGTLALGNVNALQNATLDTGISGTQAVTFVVAGNNTYNIGGLAGSDNLAIGANTISVGNKAGSHSFGADITGTGGLTKVGANSIQALTVATNYSGATSITGGTLALSGSGAINGSSGINISGGTLSISGSGAVAATTGITVDGGTAKLLHTGGTAISSVVTLTQGTLTGSGTVNTVNVGAGTGGIITNNNGVAGAALNIGTLTLAGGASINLFGNTTAAALNVTNLTNNSAANAVTITANNLGGWTNGSTYNIIDYGTLGGTGGYNFNKVINNMSARQSGSWANDTFNGIITLTINGDNPRWMGDTDGKWNLSTTNNWKLVTGGTYTTFLATDDVLFDDNATGTTSIDIDAANVAPNTTAFNNSTLGYTLGSSGGYGISSGSLTKSGTGSLTISSINTYSGPTTLNAGTVTLSGSGTLGSGSALNLNGAALNLGGTSQTTGTVSITAPAASGDTLSNGSLTGTSYAVSNSSGNVGISSNLLVNGTAGFTKTGAGTATLSGANTWTGPTQINDGALVLSGSGTLGNAAALTMGGGSLNLGGTSQTVGSLSVTSAAASGDTISNGSLTGTSYAASNASGNAIISANLLANGAAGFSMSGAGSVTLSGTNTYTGNTTVNTGTLIAGSSNAFTDKGALVLAGTSVFDLGGYNASFKNLTTTSGNTITTSGSGTDTDTLTITGMTAASGALFTDGTTRKLAVSINGTATLDPLSNSSNTFSGGLSLLNMRLSVVDNSAATGGRYGKGTITIGTGSQLYFNVANKTISNDITVNANSNVGSRTGAFRVDTAGHTLSGTITAGAADAMFNAGGGVGGLLVTGKITGNSGLQVRNTNGTSLTLTLNNSAANNDYLGVTSVGESTAKLILGAADQIPNGSGKGNVSVTGTLDMGGFSETINGLSGAGIVEGATTGTPTNTLTLGDGDVTGLNFSGVIQDTVGTLSLTKIGSGTQILSGANAYSGATLISAGTLQIGNGSTTGSIASSASITTNGTLAFNRSDTLTQGTDFAAGIDGAGNFSTIGGGTVILSGTNSYAGTTTVTNGELRVTTATAINGSPSVLVNSGRLSLDGITAGNGKTVTVNGSGGNFFGALQGNSGTSIWEGAVVVGATAGTRIGVNAGSLKITGEISGSNATNGLTLRPNSGTTLELSGANSYAGDTTIISGTGEVKLSDGANRLPTGTKLIFGTSGTSGILNLNGQNQEIAGLSVASGTANEIKSATAATLTVNTAVSSPSIYAGMISGSTALTKTGPETLTLSGTNTYTGATLVSGGVLAVNGSLANTSTTIADTGTLRGIGSIVGSVTVQDGGTIAAGNSIESLATGALTIEAGGTFAYEIDYNAAPTVAGDLTAVTGNLTLDPSNGSLLTIGELGTGIGEWSIGDKLTLISYSGTWNGSLFNFQSNTLTDGSTFTFSGMEWTFNYDDDSAGTNYAPIDPTGLSFVTMTAVPEPRAALLGSLGLLMLLRRRRD